MLFRSALHVVSLKVSDHVSTPYDRRGYSVVPVFSLYVSYSPSPFLLASISVRTLHERAVRFLFLIRMKCLSSVDQHFGSLNFPAHWSDLTAK